MKHTGTITRVQHGRDGVVVIIETAMGLRGIEMDREDWAAILADIGLSHDSSLSGWAVEYNPANGDFELIEPGDGDEESPEG